MYNVFIKVHCFNKENTFCIENILKLAEKRIRKDYESLENVEYRFYYISSYAYIIIAYIITISTIKL